MTRLEILNYYTNIDPYNMCIVNITAYIRTIPNFISDLKSFPLKAVSSKFANCCLIPIC